MFFCVHSIMQMTKDNMKLPTLSWLFSTSVKVSAFNRFVYVAINIAIMVMTTFISSLEIPRL